MKWIYCLLGDKLVGKKCRQVRTQRLNSTDINLKP